jgi:translation initiation factor IF-1
MPGISVHSSNKNMSKSKRSTIRKNTTRIDAASRGELEGFEYGKIFKTLGNKSFIVIDSNKQQRHAHIRGRLPRIAIDDVVLMSIRDYESRSDTDKAIYDIMALLGKKEVSQFVKSHIIPSWMSSSGDDDHEELFDYSNLEDGGLHYIEEGITKHKINLDEDEINIDDI